MNRRVLQIAEVIKRVLGQYLQVHPVENGSGSCISVTVTQVVLSKDYGWADVFVAPLYGQDIDPDVFLEVMRGRLKLMRHHLAREANLKRTPQLRIIYDESFEKAMRTEQILRSEISADS